MFKPGETVICIEIDDHPNKSLTVGNRYVVVTSGHVVYVLNDFGHMHCYSKHRFITIEQDRKNKLNRICSKLAM